MTSNTDVVRVDDASSMGGGTNTSMASIGMAGTEHISESQRTGTNAVIIDNESEESFESR